MEGVKDNVSSFVTKLVSVKRQANTARNVCGLFILILGLRFILTTFPVLNLMLDIHDIHVELQDLLVVVLDFLLCVEYGVSTTNMISWLFHFQRHTRQNIMKESFKLTCKNARVMTVTVLSLSIAGWMFIFVRRTWTGHLCYIVQILHLFTSTSVMLQTIFSGLFIGTIPAFMGGHKQLLQTATTSKYKQDLAWHKWSNTILIVYTALNFGAACAEENGSCMLVAFVCLLVEVFCRVYIIRGLYYDPEGGYRQLLFELVVYRMYNVRMLDIDIPPIAQPQPYEPQINVLSELYMLHVVHGTDIPGTDVAVFSNPYPALGHMYGLGGVELDHIL